MASCSINIGKTKVDNALVSKALKAAEGISDFDIAVVKSYEVLKDVVSNFGEWETYLKNAWETIPKTREIKTDDFYEGIASESATELEGLLNIDKQGFKNAKGETITSLSPAAEQTLGTWKDHLIKRETPLSDVEIKRLLKSLQAVVEVGKREAKIDQMRVAARRVVRTKLSAKLQEGRNFNGLNKLLGVSSAYIKKFTGNTAEYTHAEMMEDYKDILEVLAERKVITEITDAQLNAINAKVGKMITVLGTIPPDTKAIKQEDKPAATKQFLEAKETIDPNDLALRNEREMARDISKITEEDLGLLTAEEIINLTKSIAAIKEGILPHAAVQIIAKITEEQTTNLMVNAFQKVELRDWVNGWSRLYGDMAKALGGNKKEIFNYLFRSRSTAYAGTVIGDKTNVLFRKVSRPLAVADERATNEKQQLYNKEDRVSNLLGEAKGRVEKIYTTAILSFMEQDEANEDQWSAEELVDKFISDGRNSDLVSQHDIDLMVKLKNKYMKNGKFDKAALVKAVESDKGMKALREYNLDNGRDAVEKQIHNHATMRGKAAPIVDMQSPLQVLWTDDAGGSLDPTQTFAKSMDPREDKKPEVGLKSEGIVPVVSFDLLSNSTSFAAQVVVDYHVTPAIKLFHNTAKKALSRVNKDAANPTAFAAAKGWKQFMDSELDGYLARHSENFSWLNEAAKAALKAGYAAKLVRADKMFSEVVGGFGWWLLEDAGALARGMRSPAVFRKDLGLILQNIGSFQTSKLTGGGEWTGKTIDATWLAGGKRRGANKAEGTGILAKVKRNGKRAANVLSIPGKVGSKISSWAMSGPDMMTNRPGTMGVFERGFEELSGIKLTNEIYDLIAANDEAFMAKHGENLTKAIIVAEEKSVRSASTSNPIASVAKFKKNSTDNFSRQLYKVTAGFLMSFSVNEGASGKYYFRGMMGREEITRTQAVKGYSALLVRMATYRPMMTAFAVLMGYLALSGDDDDEKKTWSNVWDEFIRDLIGSFITVTTQGTHGSHVRQAYSQFTEYINRNHLGYLRDYEDYEGYDHSLTFSLIRDRDFDGRTSLADIVARFTGPAGSALKDGEYIWDLYNNKHSNTDDLYDDFFEELMLITAAYTNMLPFYRDIVNDRKKDRYKDKNKRRESKKKRGSRDASRGKRKQDKRG